MEVKTCTKCEVSLPIDQFAWKNKKKNKRHAQCHSCRKETARISYRKHRKKVIAKRKIQVNKYRHWYREYKKTLKCSRCPENHPSCLEFHHRDPETKLKEVGMLYNDGYSIGAMKREIAKCDVLCANCHRKLHCEERQKLKEEKLKIAL